MPPSRSTQKDLKTSEFRSNYTLEDLRAEWKRKEKWREDNWFFARCEDFYDFFRYTVFRVIQEWKREVQWVWQRVFRGYDDVFIWNLHNEHTKLMLKVLKHFRESHVGSPIIRKRDWFGGGKDPKDDVHAFWDKQLEIMIDGFEAQQDIDELDYLDLGKRAYDKKYKELKARWKNGMNVFVEHYEHLWD